MTVVCAIVVVVLLTFLFVSSGVGGGLAVSTTLSLSFMWIWTVIYSKLRDIGYFESVKPLLIGCVISLIPLLLSEFDVIRIIISVVCVLVTLIFKYFGRELFDAIAESRPKYQLALKNYQKALYEELKNTHKKRTMIRNDCKNAKKSIEQATAGFDKQLAKLNEEKGRLDGVLASAEKNYEDFQRKAICSLGLAQTTEQADRVLAQLQNTQREYEKTALEIADNRAESERLFNLKLDIISIYND